jgi:hypothetical protein
MLSVMESGKYRSVCVRSRENGGYQDGLDAETITTTTRAESAKYFTEAECIVKREAWIH